MRGVKKGGKNFVTSSRSVRSHHAFTMTEPVMCGWIEQKYPNCPGLANVNENFSPVSSTFDLKTPSFETTVWGMSSPLVHVTVVPGFTVTVAWLKVKFPIWTDAVLAGAAFVVVETVAINSAPATSAEAWNVRILKPRVMDYPLVSGKFTQTKSNRLMRCGGGPARTKRP